ncbi:DUF4393 domain-containing protein [Bacillus toyonensis]|uniref:DUF4393 domain-containing protein n=1 Tax=Bacillus toyonensis TaxID=155322 RepID=UPI000BF5BEB4|nr:DUF4393 domain-containing protein [Bacillus toyonensis]PFY25160.1 hypothetical protein COL44_15100 [Bacillus toyonensis]PHG44693.1 hypothetical protein COI57_22595 [Bacillus toyonensis]
MDPIITSAVTSFVTTMATNSTKAPLQTLDNLWYLAFGKFDNFIEKKRIEQQISLEAYKSSITEKLSLVDENNLQEPKMSIVGPALEASKYYIEEESLREMFANLIAASMDKENSENVHPSFVEIIKQLSAEDARNIMLFKEKRDYPIVQLLKLPVNDASKAVLSTNIFSGHESDITTGFENAASITNLSRLGLVSVSYDQSYSDTQMYDLYENSTLLKEARARPETEVKFAFDYGIMRITPFGDTFIKTCL